MVRTILRVRLPLHPRLGWHPHQDSRSWAYALQPKATPINSIRHQAYIDILDQGQVGSCTGNASVSCSYHAPFFSPTGVVQPWERPYSPDETGALAWYHQNTVEDGYQGTYPPDDTGSDSLTSSKVAKESGVTSGYQMAGDLTSSLEALQTRPGITGIPWFNSMFDAPSSGLLAVDTASGLAGGHELCVDEVVAASAPGNSTGQLLVGGPNSWGSSWGASGRWYLKASDWWALRQQQGDFYSWTPAAAPAPQPTPSPDANQSLWDATSAFRHDHHVMPHIVAAARALDAWGELEGFKA